MQRRSRPYRGQPYALQDLVLDTCQALETTAAHIASTPHSATVEMVQEKFQTLIRSSALINPVHEWVAGQMHAVGVPATSLLLEHAVPILDGDDFKNVDLVACPHGAEQVPETWIAVGVKGHFMNKSKNIDNNANAARGDVDTLHESHPTMVVGRFDVTLTHELNLDALTKGHIVWERWSGLPKAILKRFRSFGRTGPDDQYGKAETFGLLIINPVTGEHVETASDPVFLGLDRHRLSNIETVLQNSAPDVFAPHLLAAHRHRHPTYPVDVGYPLPVPPAASRYRTVGQNGQQPLF